MSSSSGRQGLMIARLPIQGVFRGKVGFREMRRGALPQFEGPCPDFKVARSSVRGGEALMRADFGRWGGR